MLELRPYQLDGEDGIRELLRAGHRKVLVISPTGSGKTIVFSDIIRRAAEKSSRCLVLAHRTELIQQTSEKLSRFEVRHGIIQGDGPLQLQHAVQVASVQTLVRRPGLLQHVDVVVVDEAHHFTAANTYGQILGWFPSAILLGFTATPWRLDGQGLGDNFDAHLVLSTPRKLRDAGFLVPVTGYEYTPIETKDAKVSKGDYVAKSLESSALKIFGAVIDEWKQHAGGGRSVLFATTVRHSEEMAAAFRRAGVPAEHLDGETPQEQRRGILRRLESGETRVLCNVNVATEGWDLPALECAILCRPTLSLSLALQMCGRILRPAPGKAVARIHDHARVLSSHGHPYSERDWSPDKSSKVSRATVDANVKRGLRCPQCRAVIIGFPCSGCGHQPTPKALEQQKVAERHALLDTPEWRKLRADVAAKQDKAAKWALLSEHTKRRIFEGLCRKIGSRGALGAYRSMSGETEWPPYSWRLEASGERAG